MTISVNSRKKQVKKSFEDLIKELQTSNSEKVRYNAARILMTKTDLSDYMQQELSVNSEMKQQHGR